MASSKLFFTLLLVLNFLLLRAEELPVIQDTVPLKTAIPQLTNLSLQELRIIVGKKSLMSEIAVVKKLAQGLKNQGLKLRSISFEKNIPPPQPAIDNLPGALVVRYFHGADLAVAELFQKIIQKEYHAPTVLQDMRPYYSNDIPHYIEIWINR